MTRPRIFIAAHYLEIGGAEISLIGLLNAIDYSRFDVDLFLYARRGELLALVPEEVNILPEIPAYAQMENPIREVISKGHWRQALARLRAKVKYDRWRRRNNPPSPEAFFQYLDNEITPGLPSLHNLGEYDLAVNFIALKNQIPAKVRAKKTAVWIHTDFSTIPLNAPLELPAWKAYDHIVSISPQVTASFTNVFPSLAPKITEIENILSPAFVRARAEAFDAKAELDADGAVKLLSVGRFCTAKNYDNVPDICRRIVEKGLDIVWYIIGFGGDEDLIRRKIAEAGMEKRVIILGKKTNPYPYIKACDIYVQPSRYEGKSVTVREAQMLCRPVAVTDYKTASSQIADGVNGRIVPMANEACADALAAFIADTDLQARIIRNLTTGDFGNESEIDKFYDLI